MRIEWGVMTRMARRAAGHDTGEPDGASADATWPAPHLHAVTDPTHDRRRDRDDGIRELYGRRHADMVRFAAFLSGDADAADDLAHEAFLRVFDAWDRIDDPERIDAYLTTTVVNLVKAGFRRRQVAERHADDRRLELVASAEDDAIGRLRRDRVLAAVAALPLRQRACVVMRHWMRMTESEIARTLGVSVGSVRTHVKRGTATLKRELGNEMGAGR